MTEGHPRTSQLNHPLAEQVQNFWERSWSRSGYNPTWVVAEVPDELRAAVESHWFASHSALLDIGCGSGELSAWLAEQHFMVHGVDCSHSAIARARTQYADLTHRLTFQVVDICRDVAPAPQYAALFDRACLHGLPKALHADYVETVASWALPGARFLLLYGLHRDVKRTTREIAEERAELQAHLEQLFTTHFTIMKSEPTVIKRSPPHEPVPGLAVWMTRI